MKVFPLLLVASLSLSQAQAFVLPKQVIKPYDCEACTNLSHEIVSDNWSIDKTMALNSQPSNAQKSYAYSQLVSMKQLRAGVPISTFGPKAVIRIEPVQSKYLPQFELLTPSHKVLKLVDASSDFVNDSKDNTLAHQTLLQLKPELGTGTFLIRSQDSQAANEDTYRIHVLDTLSMNYLQVETNALSYHYGDEVITNIALKNHDTNVSIEDLETYLVSPSSEKTKLEIQETTDHVYQARVRMTSEAQDHGENWYIEVNAYSPLGQDVIRRSGHVAFSYAIPSATMHILTKISSIPLTFMTKVEVSTASRYALSAILFRKNDAGEVVPVEIVQKAQWLTPGMHMLHFSFDNVPQLEDDTLYLGYLRIIDYGQLKPVYEYNAPISLRQLMD